MRKSFAPSFRKSNNPSTSTLVASRLLGDDTVDNNTNSENKSEHSTRPDSPTSSTVPSSNKQLIFNVVWGKRSNKKHKTYEDDGTLSFLNNTATLRDSNGSYLGSTSIKVEIEIGGHLIVGSYEIEIIEQAIGAVVPVKRKVKEEEESTSKKKTKSNSSFFQPYLNISNAVGKQMTPRMNFGLSIQKDYTKLIMPEPTREHQLKFNTSKRPVKEVSIIPCCAKELRLHQREGVQFLYECLMGFRSLEHFGCILADEMGLGKTLQCISVCYTLLKQGPYGINVANRILIITPSSLVENWSKEINKWLGSLRAFTFQIDSKHKVQDFINAKHIPFLLISYEMFVKQFEELKEIHFDIIVCDEGHRLKNQNIKVSTLLNQVDCPRRVILTGTPIQNDLEEFYALIDFVNPNCLGTYVEYKAKYEQPIVASQQPDTSEWVLQLGKERAKELTDLTSNFILRRTQDVINKYLPQKQEFIVFCKQSELQRYLIEKALEFYEDKTDTAYAFQIITNLKKICNHPALINTGLQDDEVTQRIRDLLPSWQEMGSGDSGKLIVLQNLLQEVQKRQEKIVLISYHTTTLNMLSGLLDHSHYTHCRLDGTTPSNARSEIVERFNNPASETFVLLLSAKAGGCGLNLIGASRLVLFDNDWNPASDLQAISRIWRDGQKKAVFIYRFVLAGSIEEKIFQRQLSKVSLTGCIVDQSSKREKLKLCDSELKDLFSIRDTTEDCITHKMLNCQCFGDGQNVKTSTDLETMDFEIDSSTASSKSLPMNELLSWQHYQSPVDSTLLTEMCMPDVSEEIVFIFRNQNDI